MIPSAARRYWRLNDPFCSERVTLHCQWGGKPPKLPLSLGILSLIFQKIVVAQTSSTGEDGHNLVGSWEFNVPFQHKHGYIRDDGHNLKITKTRMWANAQRDGCPAKYRWRRKVWLTPTTGVPCSNAAKTRNPLKLAGVPRTPEPISAISGPKFTILWGHVAEVLLPNKFFSQLPIHALIVKI